MDRESHGLGLNSDTEGNEFGDPQVDKFDE